MSTETPVVRRVQRGNGIDDEKCPGELLPDEVDDALAVTLRLGIELVENDDLHRRALAFGRRFELAALYDAHYLALARQLDCELWTFDKRLAKAVDFPGLRLAH